MMKLVQFVNILIFLLMENAYHNIQLLVVQNNTMIFECEVVLTVQSTVQNATENYVKVVRVDICWIMEIVLWSVQQKKLLVCWYVSGKILFVWCIILTLLRIVTNAES
jgi:hypothetical protein